MGSCARRVSGAILEGSDLFLVQAVFLQRHHPSAEQVDTGAAVHRSLEGLQFVDLSFGLPVAPRFQHSVPNSLQVLAYRPRKTLHRVCRFTLIAETGRVRHFRALPETRLFSRHPNWDWRPIFVHLKWD